MDAHRDTTLDLGPGFSASLPPEVGKLVECDERLSSIAAEATELQAELVRLRLETEAVERLLSERDAALAEKELSLTRLEEENARARRETNESQAALAEVEVLLDGSRTRVAALESELAALQADVAERQSVEEPARTQRDARSHLRLVPLPGGYALAESPEPPPRTGGLVEIEGREFSVAKIGRSPLPGDPRACAYLMAQPG